MVYQGFKVLKRNPTFYNPRSAGMVALAYLAYSFYFNKYLKPTTANFDDYNESHPHTHEEKVRQYHDKQNQLIRSTIEQQRAEHDSRLRNEARD